MEEYTGKVAWKGSGNSDSNWEFTRCSAEETQEMKY